MNINPSQLTTSTNHQSIETSIWINLKNKKTWLECDPYTLSILTMSLSNILNKKTAFTLVELMIVIAILGILAGALFPAMSSYIDRSKRSAMQQDMDTISKTLQIVMWEYGISLMNITNNWCTACSCYGQSVGSSISGTCAGTVEYTWNNIFKRTNGQLKNPMRDPWWGTYLFDENFWEWSHDPCRLDYMQSAGPDNIFNTSDDIHRLIPFPFPCP
jgi:prepilin-type N-terminal cleavage/methylation domain-containing protein